MKYALVTGSGRGIGKAVKDALSKEGYEVISNGLQDRLKEANYIAADLSTLEGVKILADKIRERNVKLSCLVLNAGITCRKKYLDLTFDDWQEVMNTNVILPNLLIENLYSSLEDEANIIFIGSSVAINAHATSVPYGVSKASLSILSKNLAREFEAKKIRVNTVCPGFIETDWQTDKPDWIVEKINSKTSAHRFGKPEEVAQICVSICKNQFINGSNLVIDGGYNLSF